MRFRDLAGQTIGNWLVLKRATNSPAGKTRWRCRCRCGNTTLVYASNLTRSVRNKGCHQCINEIGPDHLKWKGCGELPGWYWHKIRESAMRRDLECSITIQEMWNLFLEQDRKCALTGWPLAFAKKSTNRTPQNASLDRIDSKRGYVLGNVQWVDKEINLLKGDMPNERFLYLCRAITDHDDYQ